MLTATQARIVGCLMEKQVTTPDLYPLTLNALCAAANQTSNRDPVLALSAAEIESALGELKGQFIRVVHSPSNRATKYRQIADEALHLDEAQAAVLTVLLLRGPQTAGELRTRTDRLHPFESVAEVEAVLEALAEREPPLVQRLNRAPGQKEARWLDLVGDRPVPAAGVPDERVDRPGPVSVDGGLSLRVAALEERVAAVEAELADLRRALGG